MSELYSHHALSTGTMIQEYRLTGILGIGGFGIVYVAENIYLDETVAIKEFLPAGLATRIEGTKIVPVSQDKEEVYDWALKNFLKEAKILWELSRPEPHRSIVRVTRFHEDNGTAYMVMDYEEGQSLASILKKSDALPEAQIKAILFPLLDGLEKVHGASIWHRDIKPDNILVRADGSPVLIDFGAAHRDIIGGDQSLMSVFSPAYAAPEQVFQNGKQGPWTDIYALGVTLYQATTGVVPPSVAERYKDTECDPASELAADNYSPALLEAIDAALVLAPEARPQSINEWRRLIEGEAQHSNDTVDKTVLISTPLPQAPHVPGLLSGETSEARPSVAPAVLSTPNDPDQNNIPKKRPRILAGLGIAGILLLVGGGLLFVLQPFQAAIEPLSNGPEKAIPTADVVVAEPVDRVDRNAAISRIQNILDLYRCSYVEPTLDKDLHLRLFGFVENQNDLQQLDSAVSAGEGITSVEYDVKVIAWPFCEMAELRARHQPADLTPDQEVHIEMNKPGHAYQEGEFLVVTATASSAFDGYLYIDYIDSAGDVVHMFPPPLSPDNRVTAGQQVVAGTEALSNDSQPNDSQQRAYQVFPPHGQNMIIAISSREPLYDGERMEVESAADYLATLRDTLSKIDPKGLYGGFISTYSFITTHE